MKLSTLKRAKWQQNESISEEAFSSITSFKKQILVAGIITIWKNTDKICAAHHTKGWLATNAKPLTESMQVRFRAFATILGQIVVNITVSKGI
jgi:hypothetical protein